MKIRLIGSPDLVKAWISLLEREYGLKGAMYPNRYGDDMRVYFDIDDRQAAAVVGIPPAIRKSTALKGNCG